MNPEIATTAELMKSLILNTSEPVVIKDVLNWDLLHWDLQKWHDVLGNESLQFRRGKNAYTKEPQFENTTETVCMSFKQFLDHQEKNPHEWLYFDYKYLKEWLTNIPEFRKHISWEAFGFPNRDVEDSTIWIGSKGAHTPCHVDTYGCNLIAQIQGRKRWILFSPTESLHPTRVPYEESSIYSKINLFTPNGGDFKNVTHCRTVLLNPGDVLVLPHRWWHYVENIDLAISINTWIELPDDYEERLGESLALTQIVQIAKQLNPELQQYLLNPMNGSQGHVLDYSFLDCVNLVTVCLEQHKMKRRQLQATPNNYNAAEILNKLGNAKVVEQLSDDGLKMLLEMQRNKFDCTDEVAVIDVEQEDKRKLLKVVEAMLHSDVINLIQKKLLEDG